MSDDPGFPSSSSYRPSSTADELHEHMIEHERQRERRGEHVDDDGVRCPWLTIAFAHTGDDVSVEVRVSHRPPDTSDEELLQLLVAGFTPIPAWVIVELRSREAESN